MALTNVAVVAKDGNSATITGGVRQHDTSGVGTGPNVPEVVAVDSTGAEIIGTTADAVVAAGAAGSLSAKLRAISRDLVANIVLAAGSNLVGLFKLSDGTNTAAVKAASTAPVATDPAVVVSISPNSVNANITALSGGTVAAGTAGAPVVAADQYATHKEVIASQTAAVLGATGAIGDYLAYVTVFPGTAGCGVVTILDAAATVGTFAGGGVTALPSLVPFTIQIGAFCTGAGWKITTGANVTVTAVGKFT